MSAQNPEHDRLVERLRAGLDDLTASVRQDPPDLGVPRAAATESVGGGGGRGRWMTTAAASIFAVAAIGGIVWVAGDADAPSGIQPEASTTASNETLGADASSSSISGEPASSLPQRSDTAVPGDAVSVIATVLENGEHGPQVCGAVAESFPPQCGGADITNWDWSTVDGDQSANGTRWGEYVLVGAYNADGTAFTLTEPARIPTAADRDPSSSDPDFSTPCAEPQGGWNSPYPDQTLDESVVRRRVQSYGGMWIDEASGVYNVKIVGGRAARDAATSVIESVYSGPICIVEGRHTWRELSRIQTAVGRLGDPRIVSIGTDVLTNQVQVSLTAPAPELEDDLAARYGDAIAFEHLAQPADSGSQLSVGAATASTAVSD